MLETYGGTLCHSTISRNISPFFFNALKAVWSFSVESNCSVRSTLILVVFPGAQTDSKSRSTGWESWGHWLLKRELRTEVSSIIEGEERQTGWNIVSWSKFVPLVLQTPGPFIDVLLSAELGPFSFFIS